MSATSKFTVIEVEVLELKTGTVGALEGAKVWAPLYKGVFLLASVFDEKRVELLLLKNDI
jgi:hypothetical protein